MVPHSALDSEPQCDFYLAKALGNDEVGGNFCLLARRPGLIPSYTMCYLDWAITPSEAGLPSEAQVPPISSHRNHAVALNHPSTHHLDLALRLGNQFMITDDDSLLEEGLREAAAAFEMLRREEKWDIYWYAKQDFCVDFKRPQ
jgi:hypothetical protein